VDDTTHNIKNGFKACFLVLVLLEIRWALFSLPPPPDPKRNRVISKVRKTQHRNPEFGHTQDEIQIEHAKMYIRVNRLVTNHISDQGRPDPWEASVVFGAPTKIEPFQLVYLMH
jgi:hypothetical protein